jgi:hypothetical protein
MKPGNFPFAHCAFGAVLAAATMIAACTTSSAPVTNAAVSQSQGKHRVGPLVLETTTVKFYNSGSSTIYGSGSSTCWSVSPTPLPSLAPDAYSGTITLGYDTTCINGPDDIAITYGPSSGPDCTFITTYSVGFQYQAVNNELTDCTATPSGAAAFDELYSYDPAGSVRKHR